MNTWIREAHRLLPEAVGLACIATDSGEVLEASVRGSDVADLVTLAGLAAPQLLAKQSFVTNATCRESFLVSEGHVYLLHQIEPTERALLVVCPRRTNIANVVLVARELALGFSQVREKTLHTVPPVQRVN